MSNTTIEQLMADPQLKDKFLLEKLICHFMNISRNDLRTQSNTIITDNILNKITQAYHKATIDKMPMEYILGYVEFFGIKFRVNEHTLIPRPETEYMIQAVREYINQDDFKQSKYKKYLIDVGTGCGVLGISVLLSDYDKFEDVIFTDITDQALDIAKQNQKELLKQYNIHPKYDISIIKTNLLEGVLSKKGFLDKESLTIIVANLPYIPDEMFDDNAPDNVKHREPRFAFVGGSDGLDLYREMFKQIPNDSQVTMFLEMMTWQVDIIQKEFPQLHFEEVKTFHFNIRIVRCTTKTSN